METQKTPEWLRTVCLQNNLVLSETMFQQLESLVSLLLEWNQKINLISRRDEENVWSAHILHSLSILMKLQIPKGADLLDIGTGGGLPGLPLQIARPDLKITLLDSTQKKINVVSEITSALKLKNAHTVWGRAEEVGRKPPYSKSIDFVVARGVAPLKDLVRWSMPFLRREDRKQPGVQKLEPGRRGASAPALIALKGGDLEQELAHIRASQAVNGYEVINLTLNGSTQLEEGEKKIVVVNLQTRINTKQSTSDGSKKTL